MTWVTDDRLRQFADSRPFSPAAAELGRRIIAIDPSGHRAKLSFEPAPHHCNPLGGVQGGFLIAMLDEAMIEAIILAAGDEFYIPTLSIEARFLAPARREKLIAVGRILRHGRRTAFLEAEIYDRAEQVLLVSGRSTVTKAPWHSLPQAVAK